MVCRKFGEEKFVFGIVYIGCGCCSKSQREAKKTLLEVLGLCSFCTINERIVRGICIEMSDIVTYVVYICSFATLLYVVKSLLFLLL